MVVWQGGAIDVSAAEAAAGALAEAAAGSVLEANGEELVVALELVEEEDGMNRVGSQFVPQAASIPSETM